MTEAPRRPDRNAAWSGFVVLILAAVAGLWIDFIPAPWWRGAASVVPAVVLALLATLPVAIVVRKDDVGTPGVLSYPPPGAAEQVLRGVMLVILALPFAWMATVTTLPWLATRVAGSADSLDVELESAPARHREACAATLRGPVLGFPATAYLCLAPGDYERHPERRLQVRLHGSRSAFGFSPEAYEIVADLGPASR